MILNRATIVLTGAWLAIALGLVANVSVLAQYAQNNCPGGTAAATASADRC